ncbi:MAG: phosphoenolpyruvate carboxykinase (ATP) [candidate division Zixibacteria bacterium]
MSNNLSSIKTPAPDKAGAFKSEFGLDTIGLTNLNTVYWNLNTEDLYEEILFRGEGIRSEAGPIIVHTGEKTARSTNDKFTVKESTTGKNIWWGEYNRPFNPDNFNALANRIRAFMQKRDVFVQDCYACADENYRLPVRVITEYAWHSLHARNMLIQPQTEQELKQFVPEFSIIDVPSFCAAPEIDGTASSAFVILNLEQRLCLIGNIGYAGEIKKSVFSILNYLLPQESVLTMHCGANTDSEGNTALFLGLSGTGKTTLSTDSIRNLVGDDEIGWNDEGIFNFEGGCYAKTLSLSPDDQPIIYSGARKFGTVLENVIYNPETKEIDFNDGSLTENTRAAYPLKFVENSVATSTGNHPKNIFLLTCDANGVIPPIARLTPEQAIYYFISGYTSKIPGTEMDLGKEPEATFSPCFAAPFMPHHPCKYAKMLKNKILRYNPQCWLINTGWIGGKYGVGKRVSIPQTRTLIHAALDGTLDNVDYHADPVFGFNIPEICKDIPKHILRPELTRDNPDAYRDKRRQLALLFIENFKKFADNMPREIIEAGPELPEKITV